MPQKRKELKIEGPNLWYLVGLITSDGNLSKDGRHIDITSAEKEFLASIKSQFGFSNRIGNKYNSIGQLNYHFQLTNRSLYEFLESIGLSPCKSLILKELNVPKDYFCDFLRGLIDGDGCIQKWFHPSNKREQWSLRIYSGSIKFLEWIEKTIGMVLKARGKIYRHNKQGSCYVLKFGKMAARHIVQQCYYPGSFGLERKNLLAEECINSYIGWDKSKTVDSLNFS